jgi:1,4-dihydroxy-6-naphthoate synthase
MLDALIHQRIPGNGIEWKTAIEDVETLNRLAMQGTLDVTKLSFSTWLRVQDKYALLNAGAALGHGCGPLVISTKARSEKEILQGPIAIPGALTTANLLFALRYPQAQNKKEMIFSDIEQAVASGQVVAGVIIHENRFTYQHHGLVKVLDLGEYWEQETGCPIPLGAFAVKKTLDPETIEMINTQLRDSVQFAFDHPEVSKPFVRRHAQEMDESVIGAHISTYVNEFSLDLGLQGHEAVNTLHERALAAGLIG